MWERISPQRATAQHSRNQKGEDNHGWTPMDTEGTEYRRQGTGGNSRATDFADGEQSEN